AGIRSSAAAGLRARSAAHPRPSCRRRRRRAPAAGRPRTGPRPSPPPYHLIAHRDKNGTVAAFFAARLLFAFGPGANYSESPLSAAIATAGGSLTDSLISRLVHYQLTQE